LAAVVGCASRTEPTTNDTTFTGSSASAGASASASASATMTTGGSSGASTTAGEDSEDAASAPTDTADPTETSGPPPTTGVATTSDSGESSGGGTPSEQPEDGMYSACGSPIDCIGLTSCLTAIDTGGQPIDAFCTDGACNSPLAQCDPTPGGTAVPICLEVDSGGVMDTVCALDCSQGQACPAGMNCRTLTGGSICS
jgi:hypothetical protein